MGLALRERSKGVRVHGVDRPRILERARRAGAITQGLSMQGLMARVSELEPAVIVLAVPVPVILELLPRLVDALDRLPPAKQPLLIDVGSVKQPVLEAVRATNYEHFVGGHPMAGAERGGIEHARADLFVDAPFVLCPDTGSRTDHRTARRLAQTVGARPLRVAARAHDRVVAQTSHLPHLLAWALISGAEQLDASLTGRGLTRSLGAGSWRGATRVAAADPKLWSGIFESNRGPLLESLDRLMADLARVREGLATGEDILAGGEMGLQAGRLARTARRASQAPKRQQKGTRGR